MVNEKSRYLYQFRHNGLTGNISKTKDDWYAELPANQIAQNLEIY